MYCDERYSRDFASGGGGFYGGGVMSLPGCIPHQLQRNQRYAQTHANRQVPFPGYASSGSCRDAFTFEPGFWKDLAPTPAMAAAIDAAAAAVAAGRGMCPAPPPPPPPSTATAKYGAGFDAAARRGTAANRKAEAGFYSCSCCVPTGCAHLSDDPIDPADPGDAVRVVCSNPRCAIGRWMHADCFDTWEQGTLHSMRCYERESQFRFDQDVPPAARTILARRLRACICANGFLSRDPTYFGPPSVDQKFLAKYNGAQYTPASPTYYAANPQRTVPAAITATTALHQQLQQLLLNSDVIDENRRVRSGSFSSTGSGSCSSRGSSTAGSVHGGGGTGSGRASESSSMSGGYSSSASVTPPLSPPRAFFAPSSHVTTPPPAVLLSNAVGGSPLPQTRVRTGSGGQPPVGAIQPSATEQQQQQQHRHHHHSHHHHHHHPGRQAPEVAAMARNPMTASAAMSGTSKRRLPVQPEMVETQSVGPSARGNIFQHRSDLSVYRKIVPSSRNSYSIQLDDDGPHGNNDTRKFLMNRLTSAGVSQFRCVACRQVMTVYDEFPLVDGTLFLSPRSYDDEASSEASREPPISIEIVSGPERRTQYLQGVCLGCLGQMVGPEGVAKAVRNTKKPVVFCKSCRQPWELGTTLVLGTLYSYDIFAAAPCCSERRSCRRCGQPSSGTPGGDASNMSYSDYSAQSTCAACGLEDRHNVKPFHEVFYLCSSGPEERGKEPVAQ